jgi:hypothetical protein
LAHGYGREYDHAATSSTSRLVAYSVPPIKLMAMNSG